MKTKEELNALKEEVETLNKKLAELNEEELAQVSGGGSTYAIGRRIKLPGIKLHGTEVVPDSKLYPQSVRD